MTELEENTQDSFIRIEVKGKKVHLLTAIKTYEKENNLEIKLAGDIHLAEEEYFLGFMDELSSQDKVLIEGIKPARLSFFDKLRLPYRFLKSLSDLYDTIAKHSDLSLRTKFIKDFLNLHPDDKPKYEFCDITIKEFINEAKKNNEEKLFYSIAISVFPLMKIIAKTKPEAIKAILTKTNEKPSQKRENNHLRYKKTILDVRNRIVKERLSELLREKKEDYKIGVFYGAGHMQDLENYILEHQGFQKKGEKWFKAFDAINTNYHKDL